MTECCQLALSAEDIDALVARINARELRDEDHPLLSAAMLTLAAVTQALREKETSIARLRQLIFGGSSEKTSKVLKQTAPEPTLSERKEKPPPKGHGRNGAEVYTGATVNHVPHESLRHGDACPCCEHGKVYLEREPQVVIWIKGNAPLNAARHELDVYRCNRCRRTFVAAPPAGVGDDKYDESAVSMLAVMKYGTGMPWYRLEQLQASCGIPVPASTQWQLLLCVADRLLPAFKEILRLAAQGRLIHNDDTGMKLLCAPEVLPPEGSDGSADGPQQDDKKGGRARSGTFTSGIVSIVDDHRVAVYRTGHKHAGENLADILRARDAQLGPPLLMCDGLARNLPEEFKVILGNCMAHGRRNFIEVLASFPAEGRFVLETLAEVYANDAAAKAEGLSPEARLRLHQEKSGPVMEKLKGWLQEELDQKKTEPNSGLGKAIRYMLRRWEPLTLFLREPGAPLDNNLCERILKLAILHRKNAMFYKTMRGAHVGDLFMSLIQTCRLNGANPLEYLTALQRQAGQVLVNPSAWMPWNYKLALAALDSG